MVNRTLKYIYNIDRSSCIHHFELVEDNNNNKLQNLSGTLFSTTALRRRVMQSNSVYMQSNSVSSEIHR